MGSGVWERLMVEELRSLFLFGVQGLRRFGVEPLGFAVQRFWFHALGVKLASSIWDLGHGVGKLLV